MRHIADKETFQAMATIEGLSWDRDQAASEARGSEYTYAFALSHWEKRQVKLDALADHDPDEWAYEVEDNRPIGAIIYGTYGMNRWYVRLDGEVVFSAHHSNKETQDRVEALGFSIFR